VYFKSLEIVGFKSFLNKTKLKFEPGVTAIVGPNGCGKSNIVDAIKWVLGEQSAKSMRSSAMQDVIFNGTEKHDPVNFAEVSLTLSNEDRVLPVDYDEVIVTRRLFRSGESEYLLNKTPVRLADVRSVFMGTGIGTGLYSIVEQGKMDMILSSKPEERRTVFEEASGITRYKSQKREALFKLERTQENLTRLSDIIREVERQINSIERQARKAERYRIRYEELKELDVKLSYKKFNELITDDNELLAKDQNTRKILEDLGARMKESASFLDRQRQEFNAVMEDLQESQNKLVRLSSDIDKNEHVITVNGERIQELKKYIERLAWEIEETTRRKEVLSVRLDDLGTRHGDVSVRRQRKDDELLSSEDKVKGIVETANRHKYELKYNRKKTVDIAAEQTKTKNQLVRIGADIQNMFSREKRLKMEKNNVQAEKDNVSEDMTRAEEKVSVTGRELAEKKSDFLVFNKGFTENQQKLSVLNNERAEKQKRLNEIRPRREFLEKLVSEREGINESVKGIMKRVEAGDPRFSGVHGILSEIISVHENYEESLESVLGDAAQAIVVDNRDVVDSVIAFLRENSLESVSFVIIEELKKLLENEEGPVMTGGALEDITRVLGAGEPYCSALRVMLNDTFVTVSPDAARAFMRENDNFRGRIIVERGEVFRKGVWRSRNYSTKEVISLFGRREKVKQMRAEEERISRELDDLGKYISEMEKWLEDSAVQKERLETELREKQMEYADAASKKTTVREKFDALAEEVMLLDTEIEEESASIKQLQEEKRQLEERGEELDSESVKFQQAIEDSQKIIQDCAREREEMLFSIADIKAELSALKTEEENLVDNLERERESSHQMEVQTVDKRKNISESGERIETLDAEIKNLNECNLTYCAGREIKAREIDEKKERKEQLVDAIRREEEKVRGKEEEIEDVRNRARDLDIMKKEIEYKREMLVGKMLDAYKVNIEQLDMEIDENTDWEAVAGSIDELKAQLDNMGEVSLGAVEEHKQLEERYQFLVKQKEDLIRGREALLQAISKINRTTRKIFIETFESIRKEFNDYFRMLFNGGKGDLVLEDESNVLECGIDIIVRPPGKKLHNIMQLSGGEKAMTAVALIFAIFKVNPSPFCILDEVDAPLDESNIVRFCRVLQEFIKLSQFIIVTHNRMTIQLADVLYGITMEEKGVSKIVSVKFTEEKDAVEEETVPAGT